MVFCKKYGSFLVGYRNSPYLCIAFENEGRLAQLVQSVCLTSRGSGVRIPQRPPGNCDDNRSLTESDSVLLFNPYYKGRLAQLVQSVCLTSRGSGVRIPQRPQYRIVHKRVPTSVLELFFRLWGIL